MNTEFGKRAAESVSEIPAIARHTRLPLRPLRLNFFNAEGPGVRRGAPLTSGE